MLTVHFLFLFWYESQIPATITHPKPSNMASPGTIPKPVPDMKRNVKIHALQPTEDNGPAWPVRPQPQLFLQLGVKAIPVNKNASNKKNHPILLDDGNCDVKVLNHDHCFI